jgi:hypothetical protein
MRKLIERLPYVIYNEGKKYRGGILAGCPPVMAIAILKKIRRKTSPKKKKDKTKKVWRLLTRPSQQLVRKVLDCCESLCGIAWRPTIATTKWELQLIVEQVQGRRIPFRDWICNTGRGMATGLQTDPTRMINTGAVFDRRNQSVKSLASRRLYDGNRKQSGWRSGYERSTSALRPATR